MFRNPIRDTAIGSHLFWNAVQRADNPQAQFVNSYVDATA
jgi:hypothetical protein